MIKKSIVKVLNFCSNLYYKTRNYYLTNFSLFFSKRINFPSNIYCKQKLYFTGSGSFEVGENSTFGYKPGGFYRYGSIEFQSRYSNSKIKIGNNISTNNNIFVCSANYISIGNNSLIGQNVTIMDFEAHSIDPTKRNEIGKIGEVILGDNIWIGNNVTILKNTKIGANSIVAAGAVVSGKFPANVVIGGIPAKIIKKIN